LGGGGGGAAARRRAGRLGDAWFPYFVRIAPTALAARFADVRREAERAGRDPEAVRLACCLPIEVTRDPVPQEPDRVAGTPEQVATTLLTFAAAGVEHVALQFMVPRWPDRADQIERFAAEALPALRGQAPHS
jgi:alkanesulfonate monooxygenase SsuD/methylene tetrahydromethanopterin reductase-like flavin-dependent oxidoreductase (luciferase family)